MDFPRVFYRDYMHSLALHRSLAGLVFWLVRAPPPFMLPVLCGWLVSGRCSLLRTHLVCLHLLPPFLSDLVAGRSSQFFRFFSVLSLAFSYSSYNFVLGPCVLTFSPFPSLLPLILGLSNLPFVAPCFFLPSHFCLPPPSLSPSVSFSVGLLWTATVGPFLSGFLLVLGCGVVVPCSSRLGDGSLVRASACFFAGYCSWSVLVLVIVASALNHPHFSCTFLWALRWVFGPSVSLCPHSGRLCFFFFVPFRLLCVSSLLTCASHTSRGCFFSAGNFRLRALIYLRLTSSAQFVGFGNGLFSSGLALSLLWFLAFQSWCVLSSFCHPPPCRPSPEAV